ncbi:MAG: cytochrome P450 [Streptosporangiaceae bacterium]|nr:cytochrome P450 [Streptosporangiaceae bacterium]
MFNPLEPGFAEDPYPAYRRLRETDPVHESPFAIWLLSRYDDVAALMRSHLSVDPRNVTTPQFVEEYNRRDRRARELSMLDRDPPDHTRLRSLVTKVFTPRSIAALEPMISGLVDSALDEIAEAGQADLVGALAFPLPFEVISRMLGMPPTDTARTRELSGAIVRSLDVVTDPDVQRAIAEAADELHAITADVIAWKREHPADDLLTALIAAENQGEKLTDEELIVQVELLFIAGHETTVNLIAGGVLALLDNPGQLAMLRENPGLSGNAVEELLRYVSPVQLSRRITIEPLTVRGREIPSGTFVVAVLASANRDDRYWGPDADQLKLTRENARQHVSFGGGPHHCLGASLARLEARLAIERLVQRFPALALDGAVTGGPGQSSAVQWNGRINLRGPARLPVKI